MLTPVTVDPSHPFPHVLIKRYVWRLICTNAAAGNGKPYFGVLTVRVPCRACCAFHSTTETIDYVFLHDIISSYAAKLYRGYEILGSAPFRITRNSNLYLEEEEARSCWKPWIRKSHSAAKAKPCAWKLEAGAPPEIIERLVSTFELDESWFFAPRAR